MFRQHYQTLQGDVSLEEKLRNFSAIYQQSENAMKRDRDSKVRYAAKIFLFSLAIIGSVATLGLMSPAASYLYHRLFTPRSKLFTKEIHQYGISDGQALKPR